MAPFRADLHCHTSYSDGSLTVAELLHLAKEVGLSALAITDHDTVDAYQSAVGLAKQMGIALISGVEFSATYEKEQVHILAYSFSLDHEAIQALCQRHVERRRERNRHILALLAQKGMEVSEEEMRAQAVVDQPHHKIYGRPHIAWAMVKKGYVKTIQEAFRSWIAEGRPCYYSGQSVSVEETLSVIKAAKGKAVIAHPHLIKKGAVLEALLQMDFDGIEGYYTMMSPKSQERWIREGRRRGWLITGGSDFHGLCRPDVRLGSSFVDEETFRTLEAHYLQNQA
jgi:predicted metal-dependent phosphoesterase TrpH